MYDWQKVTGAFLILLSIAGFIALVPAQAFGAEPSRVRVIDAGTLDFGGTQIALHGIHAPSRNKLCVTLWPEDGKPGAWKCGQRAAAALEKLIAGRGVQCRNVHRVGNGKLAGRCYVQAGRQRIELNAWMVRHGWANAAPHQSRAYLKEEAVARQAGIGLWSGQTLHRKFSQVHYRRVVSLNGRILTLVAAA